MWKWLTLLALAAPPGPNFGLGGGVPDAGQRPRPVPGRPAPKPPPDRAVCEKPTQLDQHCESDADCLLLWLPPSCCGTRGVKGINRAGLPRYQEHLRRCPPEGRHCGCAPGPTILDDGSRLERNEPVRVVCRNRVCSTALGAPAGGLEEGARVFTSESIRSLPRCANAECPPAPASPTSVCPDGVSVGGRGPCVRLDGQCRWVRLTCP
jgi:hypothetical protein